MTMSVNTFIYYQQGDPQRRVSPDLYVAFDISMESIVRFDTSLLWEVGKPPGLRLGDWFAQHG